MLIAGGGQIGIETAHLLHEQGLDVTVIEMLGDILMKEEPLTRATIMPVILGSGMQILTDHRIEKVSEHAVTVTDLHTQEAKDLPFDTMVMALGTKPYNPLESAAREAFSDVRVIGDRQYCGSNKGRFLCRIESVTPRNCLNGNSSFQPLIYTGIVLRYKRWIST